MNIHVLKFGGSSLATNEKIKNVAKKVVRIKETGHDLVVVLSAPGNTTDQLLEKVNFFSNNPPKREVDMLLATGEQMAIALLAIAINELGYEALSLTGSQVGIITDITHTKAKIVEIKDYRLRKVLKEGKIVIVAGFQGLSIDDEITTLGRGGSDTTAVALAAGLNADLCEIFTDVKGVFTADPNIVPEAAKLSVVSYDEMLELSATGAKVLQLRAVEYARNYNVKIHVRSSFSDETGTIVKKEDKEMEKAIISSITHDISEAKVTIHEVPDKPGVAATVFEKLADSLINVDLIIQNISEKGATDITFTVAKADLKSTKDVVKDIVSELGARGDSYDENITKVSLVGAGMKTHPGVAAKMFRILADAGINIEMISTSTIKVSCVIREDCTEKAVKELHKGFNLQNGAVKSEEI